MRTFSFFFEELPLAIVNGIEAGLINGCVEVEYDHDGACGFADVCVEGYQRITQAERDAGKKPWVYVKAPAAVADMVIDRLTDQWRDRVFAAIGEQFASDLEAAAEYRADMRRDAMQAAE